jgi:purine-nucleoside phosphorylase
VAESLRKPLTVPFAAVPGLPAASVHGHRGCLSLGDWAGVRVLVFAGRLHRYEGHPWEDVTRPIRLAAELGARVALLTNAAGGIRDNLDPGSLMALRDHIDWTRPRWWRQQGPARPSPYSSRLREVLTRSASAAGVVLHQGVYGAVTGPCYETPAEVRALRACGADAVGMSTAREVEAGAAAGLECAAVSCITNRAAGLSAAPLNHEEVLATAAAQRGRLTALLTAFLRLESE